MMRTKPEHFCHNIYTQESEQKNIFLLRRAIFFVWEKNLPRAPPTTMNAFSQFIESNSAKSKRKKNIYFSIARAFFLYLETLLLFNCQFLLFSTSQQMKCTKVEHKPVVLNFFCSVGPKKSKKLLLTPKVSIGIIGGPLNPYKSGFKLYNTLLS